MKYIVILLGILAFVVPPVYGAGSSSVTPEVGKDIKYYNKGVKLMLDKKFSKAEKQFRKALSRNAAFAEAHNNLAYVLRKQGSERFDEAMTHYNRAIDLNPNLAQPYMYRGVLFVQMGDVDMARKDHGRLASLNPDLANELEYVIRNGREKEPEQFFGVSSRVN